jgi:transposase
MSTLAESYRKSPRVRNRRSAPDVKDPTALLALCHTKQELDASIRQQEFLDFLRQIDKQTPPELGLHLIVDNYVTHKHPKLKAWLARNPRVHLHFTPAYSSWLNQVERWFALITERAIRRNSFTSVRQLKQQIELFM